MSRRRRHHLLHPGSLPLADPLFSEICASRRLRSARGSCFQVQLQSGWRLILCLPSFLVVGFTKAGTSVFFQYLSQHRLVRTSPIKEPAYLGSDIEAGEAGDTDAVNTSGVDTPEPHKTLRWYMGLFRPCVRCERGEATPGYAWRDFSPLASLQAYRLLGPSAWIIMLVREPLQRAASHYLYFQKTRGRFRHSSSLSQALLLGLGEFERCVAQLGGWRHQCSYRKGRRAAELATATIARAHPEMWRLRPGKLSYELIQAGLYSEHIATWRSRFGARQLLVLDAAGTSHRIRSGEEEDRRRRRPGRVRQGLLF